MELQFNNTNFTVDVQNDGDIFASLVNNIQTDFKIKKISSNIFQVIQEKKNLISYAAEDDKHIYVNIEGRMFTFAKDSGDESSFDFDGGNKGSKEVLKSIMPGSVVKILVEKGQAVNEGDGLIILVAMKMESTLFASISGIVTELNVEEGEQVNTDKALIVIEKEDEELKS